MQVAYATLTKHRSSKHAITECRNYFKGGHRFQEKNIFVIYSRHLNFSVHIQSFKLIANMQMIFLDQSYKKCLKILLINLVGELQKCALERELK